MFKKFIIISLAICSFLKSEIEIRKDQPRINIKVFKSEDIQENLDNFLISNDVKTDLKDLIEYCANEEKYQKAKVKAPKIILLNGDNKNGNKWELAKVFAKEMKSFIVRMFPFELMESNVSMPYVIGQITEAGPCVLFIEQFEEFFDKANFGSKLLYQLNSTLEIIKQNSIIFVCSINCEDSEAIKEFIHDNEIVKEIKIPNPDLQSRQQILDSLIKDIGLSKDVDIKKISMLTYGWTVSDLIKLINQAKLISIKKGQEIVKEEDIDKAWSEIGYGKDRRYVNNEDRRNTAFHEAGHTLVKVLLMKNVKPLFKVTIVPKKLYYGATCYLQDELAESKSVLYNMLQLKLAGLVAEKIALKNIFNGSTDDLQNATKIATHMICHLGMSDNLVPMIHDPEDEIVKQEIKNLIKNAYDDVYKLLLENKDKLEKIANALLEKETLYAEEVYKLIGLEEATNN